MKDKFVKFVVQRRTLYAPVALITVMVLTIAFFPATPPAKVAHAQTNILNYWNFANCKWATYWNYNDQGQLVDANNYQTWMRWWTTRCGSSPSDRDPCSTDSNYVRWNVKAASNACYWRTGPYRISGVGTDLVAYIDKELETLDWTHPVSGTANFKTVALTGWAEMSTSGGWDWTMCGNEDPPDSQITNTCDGSCSGCTGECAGACTGCGSSGCYGSCADACGASDCTKYTRPFYGADTSSVKPYIYTPQSWDFSKGGWSYCTHAQHYVNTTNGSYCGLQRNDNDTVRGDWCVFVDYLGSQTFGTGGEGHTFTGNTIRITQWEGSYYLDSSGKTPDQRVAWDIVEEWYLQENRGIVEIRQWMNGDHVVTAKLYDWGTSDAYCTCCGSSICNQCYQS
jgi:hypothetical protein